MKPIVLSGIQPTGVIHLGNYLGALANWVGLQESNQCLFCVVDLHAITALTYKINELSQNTLNVVSTYIACGIDPTKSIIFKQSSIPAHTELCWILSCLTPLGWLNRMTQFKDKSGKNKSLASLGLYSYPVLMAADILLYKTELVPVGDDQRQHLELTREIANVFNNCYKKDYFPIPSPMIYKKTSRVMSLKDGMKKMSKSDISDYSRINLFDDNDTIARKIKRAKTDSIDGFDFFALKNRPEIYNLFSIYSSLMNIEIESLCLEMSRYNIAYFKNCLIDLLIEKISPIRKKIEEFKKDYIYINNLLEEGNNKAREIADKNIKEIKQMIF